MARETENKNVYKLQENTKFGEVRIADDVISMIAAISATEVEGVAGMSGNITSDLISKLGVKNLSRGVKVTIAEEKVSIELSLELKYGISLPKVCETVQEKVKSSVETMTGLTVDEVNIRIAGIALEKE
ncbi:MAG: Asp23/Gls24 family envelope stress response protein [Lachnospiraceae bacterium]|nr:Asp23/Gls24 family envelope stress response protein [Lachnospiraceae bacterium]